MQKREMKLSVLLAFLLAVIGLVTTRPMISSWNDASRMAAVESIVERGKLSIDDSRFIATGDKVFINGHFYSDKPYMTAFFGAVIYAPLFWLGLKLVYGINAAYYLVTLFTVKLAWVIGLLAFFRCLSFTAIETRERFWLTLCLGFGSLHLTWSSVFNNHSLAGSLLIIGFYFILRTKETEARDRNLFCAGFFFSLAGTVDHATGLFGIGFLFYVLQDAVTRRRVFHYLAPTLITLIPALAVNFYISGSLVPVQVREEYFAWPGSPWGKTEALSGVQANRGLFLMQYFLGCLIGKRGFLIYNPLLFFVIPSLFQEIRTSGAFRREGLLIGVISVLIAGYYAVMTSDYAGWSYSIRWFVPLLPLLFFFLYRDVDKSRIRRRGFQTAFAVSCIISFVGLINPWSKASYSETPFIANLMQLMHWAKLLLS